MQITPWPYSLPTPPAGPPAAPKRGAVVAFLGADGRPLAYGMSSPTDPAARTRHIRSLIEGTSPPRPEAASLLAPLDDTGQLWTALGAHAEAAPSLAEDAVWIGLATAEFVRTVEEGKLADITVSAVGTGATFADIVCRHALPGSHPGLKFGLVLCKAAAGWWLAVRPAPPEGTDHPGGA